MKINCSILTPESVIYEGKIDFVVVQAYDGEMGFLYNHTPLISELGIGEARLRTTDSVEYFVLEGGFVEIKENELILLAETAFRKEDLLKDEIESQIREIKEIEAKDFQEKFLLNIELKKLKARLKVASR